jgi:TRAP-type C4-dicarboxylate transport system permease small subunit
MNPFTVFIQKVADNIITPVVELLALGAFIIFVWGILQYINNSGEDKSRAEGRQHMIWGIVGMAILFSANGLVFLLTHIAHGT